MKKTCISKKVISFILALLMLFSPLSPLFEAGGPLSFAEDLSPLFGKMAIPLAAPTPTNYGPFRNVTHTLTLDQGHELLCKRNMTGEILFDWPEPTTYVDVVFIQDFSGSFDDSIANVGTAVKTMISSLNMGTDLDGSPKDRAMIVTYQGTEGSAYIYNDGTNLDGRTGYSIYSGAYSIKSTGLQSTATQLNNFVNSNFNASTTNGGTPTIDGMAEAQTRYKAATPSNIEYNNASYMVSNQQRQRKTVYILITDGVANAAKWINIPQKARDQLKIANKYAYWSGNDYTYRDYRPGGGYGGYNDISYHWETQYDRDISVPWSTSNEAYVPMLTGMGLIADDMRGNGGTWTGGTRGTATFVSAFWENTSILTGQYGNNWKNEVKGNVETKLKEMAGGNPDYYATSGSNIQDFSTKLIAALKKAASPIADQINIDMVSSILPKDYTLYKKNANGTYSPINAGAQSAIDNRNVKVDMSGLTSGSYKIVYHVSENEFNGEEYTPATLKMTFEGVETTIGTGTDGNIPKIAANPRTDCEISLNKVVSSSQEDYANGLKYKDLIYRREKFYFDTSYNFTSKVLDVKDTITLIDEVDSRLDVLDAYLVAGNSTAMNDAISGATTNKTLIAELKGTSYGNNDHDNVPGMTIVGNKITYSLPKKPTTVGSTSYPFGGYVGKNYVLVVQVKIKDTVSDAEIQAMIDNKDPVDGLSVGVPNISKIKLDNNPEVLSNVARAVPPALVSPEIKKYIAKMGDDSIWYPQYLNMDTKEEVYRYKIELDMPHDTTGYSSLTIKDTLDKTLEIPAIGDLKVYYTNAANLTTVVPSTSYTTDYNSMDNALKVELKETSADAQLFEPMADGKLSVEFSVKIREGADLAGKYNPAFNRIEIPNSSSFIVNTSPEKYSNEVMAYVPFPSIDLLKVDNSSPAAVLPGAEFTLKDSTNNTIPDRIFTSDAQGKIKVDSLIPGHKYTLTETKAPEGYVLDTANSWTIIVAGDGKVSVTEGPTGSVSGSSITAKNSPPITPTPTKWLKGESADAFTQPTMTVPYKLPRNDEIITYQIRVPITDVKGYSKLEIVDVADSMLLPLPGTVKVFLLGENTTIGANYSIEGRTLTVTKTSGFEPLVGKTLVVEFQAKAEQDLEKVFAANSEGKIPNTGSLQLNDQTKVDTNEVVIQVTKGKVSIEKTISGSDGSNPDAMTEGLTAGFDLYRVVGEADPIALPAETDDIRVGAYTIVGSETKIIDNLIPGTYYFLETSAPTGHVKTDGMIPNNSGFTIAANGGSVVASETPFTVNNRKSENPTINKMVKGVNRPEYSSETYGIGLGEVWQYALDTTIPTTAEDIEYTITDDIPTVFQITDLKVYSKGVDEEDWLSAEDSDLKGYLKPHDFSNPNHVELNVPASETAAYKGKVIRIEVSVKVKPGTNLLEGGYLKPDGTIPNTMNLAFGTTTLSSTVNIKPTILRSIDFTKKIGDSPLAGAVFKLYEYKTDGSVGDPVKQPFTSNDYASTSDYEGKVHFTNVPAGTYWMLETPPSGKLATYEKIKVVISGIGVDPAIQFFDDHNVPINTTNEITVFNNELITINGIKTWKDENNLYQLRPDTITVKLYRKIGDSGEPKFLEEKKVGSPWTYEFKDEGGSEKLLKYDPITNTPFIYYVEEEPVPNYATEIEGYNITNTLEDVTFRLVKRNGDTDEPIVGTTFILEDINGNKQEVTSGDLGIIEFSKVKKGVYYSLYEKQNDFSEPYIYNSGRVAVFIDAAGRPNFTPNVFPLIDPDKDPDTDNSGYLFKNYLEPIPVKKIKVGSELRDEYNLAEHHEVVTYQITVPVKGIGDINVLEIEDTVDDSMTIIPNSGKVFAGDDDISNKFAVETSNQLRTIKYRVEKVSGNLGAIENKTLTFEFQAKILLTPDSFIQMHPDLTVPNKAVLTINDRPENRVETNTVNIVTKFTPLKFKKVLAAQEGENQELSPIQKAVFTLKKLNSTDFPVMEITTGDKGVVKLDNLAVGLYLLEETEAPEGYLPIAPIYFKVVNESGTLKIYESDKDGTQGEEIAGGDMGDIVDPLPALPTINKMAKEQDVAMTTEGGDYKHYDMKTWTETFDYVVDISIPADVSGYNTLDFMDLLPLGLEIPESAVTSITVGKGTGAGFAPETDQTSFKTINENTTVTQMVDTQQYVVTTEIGDLDLIQSLAGKTIRYIFSAKIMDKFNSVGQLTLTNGNFENHASIRVNNEIYLESNATVKPPQQTGLVLKKIADFKVEGEEVPLKDATFELERYKRTDEDDKIIEQGPALPVGLKTDYTTGNDGLIKIDKRLENGKYVLTERYYPNAYVDSDGNTHYASFVAVYNYYVLEIADSGVKVWGLNKDWSTSTDPIYEGAAPTEDNPAKIVNRQIVLVPINKVWDDNNNIHHTRPEKLEFLLQRAIVKGEPDELDPVTGALKPVGTDEPDEIDTAFNAAAANNPKLKLKQEINISALPSSFSDDSLYRYTEEGGLYNYYIIETVPGEYKASYKAVTTEGYGEQATAQSVEVTNTLRVSKNFTLLKQDDSNPAVALAGAKFNISHIDLGDTVILETKTTDANGKIDLSGLMSNKVYTLKEIEAPAGYLVDPTAYTIIVDAEGVPTVYSNYVSEGHADNVVVREPQFTTTPAAGEKPAKHQLIITDKKPEVPTPIKKINGQDSFNLPSLSTQFEYTVEVPVETVEGMTSFVLEDTVNELLDIVAGTATVTADGKTVSDGTNLVIEGKKITFTMNSGFDKIANRTVKLSFKAKVADGKALQDLQDYVNQEGNNAGIPNQATLKINDKSAASNTVHLVPGNAGEAPTLDKKVNGLAHYDLRLIDEVFNYKVTAAVPKNVLGYNTLVIKDTLAKVLEISGGITLTAISSDGSTSPLTQETDYTLTSEVDGATGETIVTATFVSGFDFTTLAGKTVAMEFSAKIKADATAADLNAYAEGKIPNKVTIKLNDESESGAVIVTVTPPQEPTIDKKVNGEENIELDGTALAHTITYTIDATVPYNVAGMNKFQISDQISEILQVQSVVKTVTPLVAGEEDLADLIALSALTPTMENPVTGTIEGNVNIAKFAGKTIRLTITAKIDPSKDLSEYLVEGKLPNTAEIKINDQPKVSDTVDITPKTGKIKIKKELEGETGTWPAGEKAVFKLEKEVGTTWVKVKDIEITSFDEVTESGLLPGKYKLTETTAPAGYLLADPQGFTIVGNETVATTLEFKDTKVPGITKAVDKDHFEDFTKERTFTISVPITSVEGLTKLVISDSVDEFFQIVGDSAKATLDTANGTGLSVQPVVNGQTITLTKVDNFAEIANKTVILTFKVKLKDGFVYSELPAEYKVSGIPNTAGLVINDNPKVDSGTVKVKVPVGAVTLTKTADGAELPSGTSASFDLYRGTPSTGTKLGGYTTAKNVEGKDIIYVQHLAPGSYYFVETVAPQGYVLNTTPREFTITVDKDGVAQTRAGENFTDFTVDNTTSEIPTPEKKVGGLDHLDLTSFDQEFNYTVSVPVTKVDGWTEFTLTDQVDASLEVSNIKVTIDGTEYAPGTIEGGEFTVENNLITFKFTQLDKVQALVGKTVILTFDAKIEGSVEEFLKAHPNAIVGNTAQLNVGNLSSTSNEVTVTPPGEIPTPVKSINGDSSETPLKLGKKDQKFFYDVRVAIPENTTGYSKLVLSDVLEPVLETSLGRVKIYVNDLNNEALKDYVTIDGATNTVTMTIDNANLDPDFDFRTLAGKTLRLEIEANVKEGADLSTYLTDGVATIPNTANFSINGENKSSNTVNVTPPGDEPTVEKTVNDTEELLLGAKDQEFTYRVKVDVPANVEGYANITIEDTLEDVLGIVSTEAQVNDVKDDVLTEATTTENNKVTLSITSGFANYAGKSITLVIKAKIKDSVTLDQIAQRYGNSAIPNKATLNFNGASKTSNEVTVTPPGDVSAPVKTVNAQNDIVLGNITDEFVYNISYKIPTNVTGLNTLVLTDTLESVLETKEADVKVYVDEAEYGKLTDDIVISGTDQQTVSLTIKKGILGGLFGNAFEDLAGKTIRVEIKAKIKDGADLSAYTDKKVPNKSSLRLNDKPAVESNTVTVQPPKGNVILTKVVDGEPLSGSQTAKFKLYKQAGAEPNSATDTLVQINGADESTVNAANNKLTVSGLEPGNYYFVETEAPTGYTLNSTPIKFTIAADQAIALALTWNNVSDLTPVKTVNDAKAIEVKDLTKEFTYKISVPVGSTSAITKFVIKDKVNDLLTIVPGSAKATKQDGTVLADGTTNTDHIAINGQVITYTRSADFAGMTNSMVTLEFKARIKDDVTVAELEEGDILTTGIPNQASLSVNDKQEVNTDTVYVKPVLGDVELTKTADHKALEAGQSAKFDLYKGTPSTGTQVGGTLTTDANGKITVTNLIAGDYYFVEVEAPAGFKLDATPKAFKVFGGEKVGTNPVVVMVDNVRAEQPVPTKTVDGEKAIILTSLDQEFTYKVSVPVGDVNGITSFVITDMVDDFLTITSGSAKVTIGAADAAGTVEVDGQQITYRANAADIAAMANKTVTLEFKAKVKAGTTYEALVAAYSNLAIPNQASLTINNNPAVDTERVTVTPTFGSVVLTKTSEGNELPAGLSAVFSLYRVDTSGNVFIKDYQTVNGKIEVLNLSPGDYYFLEKTAPAGHILDDATKQSFTIAGNETAAVEITVDNKTPKDGPSIVKDVDGANHKNLTNLSDEFTYSVKVTVPEAVDGYQSLVIEDQIDSLLSITQKEISVEGYTLVAADGSLAEAGNLVKYTFATGFDYSKIAGKTITLTVKAKVKDGVTADQISEAYGDNKIPNTAKLVFNGTPSSSNTVTVTPPGETPPVAKDIEGAASFNLGTLEQTFKYNVKVQVPANTQGYTKLELVDTLDDVLEVVGIEVQVAGVKNQALTDKVVVTGNEVKLSLDETYDYSSLAGKLVNLVITSKIKEGADLTPFINSGGIPNKATLNFNDAPGVETDEVKVIPPGEGPTVKKEVVNTAGDNLDKSLLALGTKTEGFNYHVSSEIPANVSGYKNITIEDALEDVLQAPDQGDLKILVDGVDKTSDFASYLSLSGQVVKLELKKGILGIGGFDFTSIAGKTITLVIPASIKAGADLSGYRASEVPNRASLSFNGVPKVSNEVKVVPPGETPTPQKDVNGSSSATITDKAQTFTYNLSYDVPNNLTGITSIELTDLLESVLETSSDKISVQVDGSNYADGTKTYDETTNTVSFNLNAAELAAIKGKTVVLSIEANIKADADLTSYTDNTVPNKATITLNGNPDSSKETENVPVTLSGTVNIPVEKTWDGVELNAATLYVVAADDQAAADALTVADAVQTLNLAKATGWSGNFSNLPKYDSAGTEIKYFVKEEIPAGYTNEITVDSTGKVTVKNIETPSEVPTPQKDVNGQTSLNLGNLDQVFTYNVKVQVPSSIKNFTKFVLEDDLEDILEVVSTKVFANGVEDSVLTPLVTVDAATKLVKLDIPVATLENYKNANLELRIEAKIKEGVTAAELAAYVTPTNENGSIPNVAKLVVGDTPEQTKETANVPVTPPSGDEPGVSKEVNGAKEYALGTLHEAHTYTVKTTIASNTNGYESVVLKDKLESILEATEVKVSVGGVDVTGTIGTYGTLVNNNGDIALTLDKNFAQMAGKEVVLTITAKVKDGATAEELKPYLNASSIPNTATLKFNNNEEVEDSVKVIPPSENPTLDKKVNGADEVEITDLTQELIYEMEVTVPENTKDMTKIVLEDTFANILEIQGNATVEVKRADAVDDALTTAATAKLTTTGQTVRLAIIGATEANAYAGTTITVTVAAKIDGTKDLSSYLVDGKLPNTARLSINSDPEKDIVDTAKVVPNTEKVDIPVNKIWQYADGSEIPADKLPSDIDKVFVVLYRNGEPKEVKELTPDTEWKTSFDGLDKYDEKGEVYSYTVEELPVDGFNESQSVENGRIILVNKKVDTPTMTIPVQKLWSGGRPTDIDSITIVLTRDGDPSFRKELALTGPEWKGEFTELEREDKDGNKYVYHVSENSVSGFEASYTGGGACGFVIHNEPTTSGSLIFKKVIAGTSQALAGAEFELRGITSPAYSQLSTSDADGRVSFDHLPYGEYRLSEVRAPQGYETLTKVWTVKVDREGQVTVDGSTAEFSVENSVLKGSVELTKTLEGNLPQENQTATFALYKVQGDMDTQENGERDDVLVDSYKTRLGGKLLVEGLEKGSYYFIETEAPSGYVIDPAPISFTLEGTLLEKVQVSRDNRRESVDLSVVKAWEGGSDRPGVDVQLFRQVEGGNQEYVGAAVELNSANNWSHTWKNLDKTNRFGQVYSYGVQERVVPQGYTATLTGSGTELDPFVLTNTYGITTGDIKAYKKWIGGDSLERPDDIYFQLVKDGVDQGEPVKLTGTEVLWTDQALVKGDGTPIVYTVREVKEDGSPWTHESYTVSYDGLVVTNTYASETRAVYAKKIWSGGSEDTHVEPNFTLYRNGAKLSDVVPTITKPSDGQYLFKWEGLQAKDAYGQSYNYTLVEEGSYPDYGKSGVSGDGQTQETAFTITNTYNSPTTSHSFTKTWVGGPDVKPTIVLQLYQGSTAYGDPVSLEEGRTSYEWLALPKTDGQGKDYVYTVQEVSIGDEVVQDAQAGKYKVDVEEQGTSTRITNTYSVASTSFTVNKQWVGGPQEKPSILVILYQNGKAYGEPVELKNGTLSHTWNDLPTESANGDVYSYTAKEVQAPVSYVITVNDVENGGTIVNTYQPEKTELSVKKLWQGVEDPSSYKATFRLYGNGEDLQKSMEISGNGVGRFSDLPKTTMTGEAISYEVKEDPVPGFTSEKLTGEENCCDVVFVNYKTPAVADLRFTKINQVSETPLAGAVFELSDLQGNKLQEASSDHQGVVLFSGIYQGYYQLKETKVPQGFVDAKTTYVVEITAEGKVRINNEEAVDYKIANVPKDYGVTLIKVDEDTNKALAGAVFELYYEGPLEEEKVKDSKEQEKEAEKQKADEEKSLALKEEIEKLSKEASRLEEEIAQMKTSSSGEEERNQAIAEASQELTNVFEQGAQQIAEAELYLVQVESALAAVEELNAVEGAEQQDTTEFVAAVAQAKENLEAIKAQVQRQNEEAQAKVNEASKLPVTEVDTHELEAQLLATQNEISKKNQEQLALGAASTLTPEEPSSSDDPEVKVFKAGDKVGTYVTNASGLIIIKKLPQGKYRFRETKAPVGYEILQENHSFEIKDSTQNSLEFRIGNKAIQHPETTKITVAKAWIDAGDGHPDASFILKANGVEIDRVLFSGEKTTHIFDQLPLKDAQGKLIQYHVEELPVEGYSSKLIVKDNMFIFINSQVVAPKPETIDLSVLKVWIGGVGSEVTVQLFSGSTSTGKTLKLSEANQWTDKFTDLPKYDEEGKEIVYSIAEIQVPGYTSKILGSSKAGFVLINTKVTTPPTPVDPANPVKPVKPDQGSGGGSTVKKPSLPATGEQSRDILLLLGSLGILLGIGLLYTKRKSKNVDRE